MTDTGAKTAVIHVTRSAHPDAVYAWELLVPGEHSDTVMAMGHADSLRESRQQAKAKAAELGLAIR